MKLDVPDVSGCVYVATNILNGKKYVGISLGRLRRRIRGHFNAARAGSKLAFHCALRKYGAKGFEWAIEDHGLSKRELLAKEPECILVHESFLRGYNSTLGGDGVRGIKFTEVSLQKISASRRRCRVRDVETGEVYRSIIEASSCTGISKDAIGAACRGRNKLAGGRQFEYCDGGMRARSEYRRMSDRVVRSIRRLAQESIVDISSRRRSKGQDARKAAVIMLPENRRFESIAQASRETGHTSPEINNCCKGRSDRVGQSVFRYECDRRNATAELARQKRRIQREDKEKMAKRPVIRMTDGEIYESASDAAKENSVDCSGILACCRARGRNTLGGHVWEYADEGLRNHYQKKRAAQKRASEVKKQQGVRKRKKPVQCVETGIIFASQSDASRETGIGIGSINHCLTGRNKTAGGYTWRYFDDKSRLS